MQDLDYPASHSDWSIHPTGPRREPYLLVSPWVDLGRGAMTRRSEIESVVPLEHAILSPIEDLVDTVRCIVVTKSGRRMPCYVTIKTLRRRILGPIQDAARLGCTIHVLGG